MKIFREGYSQRDMLTQFTLDEIELCQRFLYQFVRTYTFHDNVNNVDINNTSSVRSEIEWLIACKKGDILEKEQQARRIEEEGKKGQTPSEVLELLHDAMKLKNKWEFKGRGKVKRF